MVKHIVPLFTVTSIGNIPAAETRF